LWRIYLTTRFQTFLVTSLAEIALSITGSCKKRGRRREERGKLLQSAEIDKSLLNQTVPWLVHVMRQDAEKDS
jgi:hypothetical protein